MSNSRVTILVVFKIQVQDSCSRFSNLPPPTQYSPAHHSPDKTKFRQVLTISRTRQRHKTSIVNQANIFKLTSADNIHFGI